MNEKEVLEQLIVNPKQPNVPEWVYEVESFLNDIKQDAREINQWTKLTKTSYQKFHA